MGNIVVKTKAFGKNSERFSLIANLFILEHMCLNLSHFNDFWNNIFYQ